MFLAPQCAALRCPWVSAHVLLVVHVLSCARGPLGVLFTAHLHMYNRSALQYCKQETPFGFRVSPAVSRYKKGRTPTNERTNHERNSI